VRGVFQFSRVPSLNVAKASFVFQHGLKPRDKNLRLDEKAGQTEDNPLLSTSSTGLLQEG